jgi:hypothetical protein
MARWRALSRWQVLDRQPPVLQRVLLLVNKQ